MKNKKKYIKIVLLVALIGFGVWVGLPFFIDDEVNEAAPQNTTVVSSAMPAAATETTSEEAAEEPAVKARTGMFEGRNNYQGSGTASLLEDENGKLYLRLEDDFMASNGPDLHVYIGTADDRGTDLGALKGNIGGQNYELPDDFDVTSVDTVRIWCRAFSADFAIATL
mgnify:CR=1 FL=1